MGRPGPIFLGHSIDQLREDESPIKYKKYKMRHPTDGNSLAVRNILDSVQNEQQCCCHGLGVTKELERLTHSLV